MRRGVSERHTRSCETEVWDVSIFTHLSPLLQSNVFSGSLGSERRCHCYGHVQPLRKNALFVSRHCHAPCHAKLE